MAETGWSMQDVAKIKVDGAVILPGNKKSTIEINGEDQETYFKKRDSERIGVEVNEVLREHRRIFTKKGKQGCVLTKIDKTPGRVQYKDREDIKKMNKEINAGKKDEILEPLKKEIIKYPSQLRQLIFILLNIKTFYVLNQISSFTRKDISGFFTDMGIPIKKTSLDQIVGPTVRELIKLEYAVEENRQYRITDPKFFEGTVEDWNTYIMEKDKDHDGLTKNKKAGKALPPAGKKMPPDPKIKSKELTTTPKNKKDESREVIPLSGTARVQSLISFKIEINATSIDEFNAVMVEVRKRFL